MPPDFVTEALVEPGCSGRWGLGGWTLAIQQARSAGLLSRLAARFGDAEPLAPKPWPDQADPHIESSRRLSSAQAAEVSRELAHVRKALAGLDAPVVLLKGAAYLAAGLPAAQGRIFSDIDLMVPAAALAEVESRLTLAGWRTTHHSSYDQRYYREWMHELPPLQHALRLTTLDVHHRILPRTARLRPDPEPMFECAVAAAEESGFKVLQPADMVLHGMTHLFMNDDMSRALRDLSDLDLLLRHFSARDAAFWSQLLSRAERLDLRRPLFYGLRWTSILLRTPVPADLLRSIERTGPSAALRWLMDAIWRRALRSPHPSTALPGQSIALFALYLRGHWLRMPPLLLTRHLCIKALARLRTPSDAQGAAP